MGRRRIHLRPGVELDLEAEEVKISI